MLHKLMFKLLEEIIKLQICVTNPYEKKNNQNKQDFFSFKKLFGWTLISAVCSIVPSS